PEPRARSGPRAEERLEHLLAIGLTYPSATVADGKLNAFARTSHAHLDGRRAVALRVLEEISDQTPQQSRIAAHDDRPAIELNALVAGAFLCGEREQVHVFLSLETFHRVEAAGEQDLVDQRVELGDVLLEAGLALRVGVLLHQLHRHADASERRAQLVRSVGEQRLVRPNQLLDAARRAVEAVREPRYLVAPFGLHARREVSGAERLHRDLQALEAPGQ